MDVDAEGQQPLAHVEAALPDGELEGRGAVVRRDVRGDAGRADEPPAHVQVAVSRGPVLRRAAGGRSCSGWAGRAGGGNG